MKKLLILILWATGSSAFAQPVDSLIAAQERLVLAAEKDRSAKVSILQDLKLQRQRLLMEKTGLPVITSGLQLLKHPAMFIGYDPVFLQARWVAHILSPEIATGSVLRTNDFRADSTVKGVRVGDTDYFLANTRTDGTIVYDGFGFDRGHLAPSADFRWNQAALSQSYLYSNISPQPADFNRGIWGDLEDALRNYVIRNPKSELFILTGPVLSNDLKRIERGKNKVAIPEKFWKVAYDLQNQRAIGFILPVSAAPPLHSYAVPVSEVEKLTGLTFFTGLDKELRDKIRTTVDAKYWLPSSATTEFAAIPQQSLPPAHFNTIIAKDYMGRSETVTVCGTVVSARKSRAGNILINLDKPFPDQRFTIFIRDEDLSNLPWDPLTSLQGKQVCIKGKVVNLSGTPAMYLERETQLSIR